MDINRITVIGRLTKDAELKYSGKGTPVLTFGIAVNKKVLREDKWIDEVYYFDCVIFGKKAEGLSQYLNKGKQVGIDGELQQKRWKTQDGANRSKVSIYVNLLQFFSTRELGKENISSESVDDEPMDSFDDDTIPF